MPYRAIELIWNNEDVWNTIINWIMNLSFTISKKLFLIFLVNSLIILMVSGLVINSFTGLSSQFNYNSKLLDYKITLDIIRIEQAKLKGLAQLPFKKVSVDEFSQPSALQFRCSPLVIQSWMLTEIIILFFKILWVILSLQVF